MDKLRRFLVSWFTFTRAERNGATALVVIMVLLLALPWLYEIVKGPAVYEADPEFLAFIARFYGNGEESVPVADTGSHVVKNLQGAVPGSPGEQNLPPADMVSHGVESVPVADTGSHGGQSLPVVAAGLNGGQMVQDAGNSQAAGGIVPVRFTVELNSADTACLMAVPGLGPVLSRRILKYRELLGGYYCTKQLLEVYGIDSSRYLQVIPYLTADSAVVSVLDLSEGEFRDLLRHPYLNYEQVAWIFRFRESGKKPLRDDILSSVLFSGYEAERLMHYLE